MEEKSTNKVGLDPFTTSDVLQLNQLGIAVETMQRQLEIFKNGIAKTTLVRAATIGDGILKLANNETIRAANLFDSHRDNVKITKFVPASGAASRMFGFLITFLNEFDSETESIEMYVDRQSAKDLDVFLSNLEKFPFYKELVMQVENPDESKDAYQLIKVLLSEQHFNYSNKPKGVLPFHCENGRTKTPIEAHFNESIRYATSGNQAFLHFTVSPDHKSLFDEVIKSFKDDFQHSDIEIEVRFSYQDPVTDTLAVCNQNKPIRDQNGQLVLRPAGHGALLKNLDNVDSDIIFIKNIDNCAQHNLDIIARYKKALGGILIECQTQIFEFLRAIDADTFTKPHLSELLQLASAILNIQFPENFEQTDFESQKSLIKKLLNRPIRVCGMVKNEGEPGGGPFWTLDHGGEISLQIVEMAQIDLQNESQKQIVETATHFNPVDLVCGVRNYKGEKFDLFEFADHDSGFIVSKNKDGKDVKSYELPGLWNGAMANWISVFVEVPQATFSPVKTVNDLLKPAHLPK